MYRAPVTARRPLSSACMSMTRTEAGFRRSADEIATRTSCARAITLRHAEARRGPMGHPPGVPEPLRRQCATGALDAVRGPLGTKAQRTPISAQRSLIPATLCPRSDGDAAMHDASRDGTAAPRRLSVQWYNGSWFVGKCHAGALDLPEHWNSEPSHLARAQVSALVIFLPLQWTWIFPSPRSINTSLPPSLRPAGTQLRVAG